jgi:hypothetical protein
MHCIISESSVRCGGSLHIHPRLPIIRQPYPKSRDQEGLALNTSQVTVRHFRDRQLVHMDLAFRPSVRTGAGQSHTFKRTNRSKVRKRLLVNRADRDIIPTQSASQHTANSFSHMELPFPVGSRTSTRLQLP